MLHWKFSTILLKIRYNSNTNYFEGYINHFGNKSKNSFRNSRNIQISWSHLSIQYRYKKCIFNMHFIKRSSFGWAVHNFQKLQTTVSGLDELFNWPQNNIPKFVFITIFSKSSQIVYKQFKNGFKKKCYEQKLNIFYKNKKRDNV